MKDRRAGRESVAVHPRLRVTRRSHADARLRGDARGRDGRVRKKLALGAVQLKPTKRGGSNQHPALLERQDRAMEAWYHPSIA
jgi:hypothetical protein